jgi:hypothetical protein
MEDPRSFQAHGYALLPDAAGIICVDNQPVGGMGVHYAKGSLVSNPEIDALRREALVYVPNGAGRRKSRRSNTSSSRRTGTPRTPRAHRSSAASST